MIVELFNIEAIRVVVMRQYFFEFLPLSNTKAETPMARTNVDVLFATEW